MQVKIRVLVGKNLGREIEIDKAEYVIGRGEGCDLRPKTDTVSRQHCALVIKDGQVFARDLGSKNGTTVNAQPLQGDRLLEEGDIVKAGKLEFAMVIERPESAKSTVKVAADSSTTTAAPRPSAPRLAEVAGATAAATGAKSAPASGSGARPAMAGTGRGVPANVKDAAARNIGRRVDGGQFEDDDVGDWLDEADTDERRRVADPETRQFRMDETDQITLSKPPSSESVAKADANAAAAAADNKEGDSKIGKRPGDSSADLTAEIKKEKKEPGKLPKINSNSSKDSRAAAEQTLKKFFNRR